MVSALTPKILLGSSFTNTIGNGEMHRDNHSRQFDRQAYSTKRSTKVRTESLRSNTCYIYTASDYHLWYKWHDTLSSHKTCTTRHGYLIHKTSMRQMFRTDQNTTVSINQDLFCHHDTPTCHTATNQSSYIKKWLANPCNLPSCQEKMQEFKRHMLDHYGFFKWCQLWMKIFTVHSGALCWPPQLYSMTWAFHINP